MLPCLLGGFGYILLSTRRVQQYVNQLKNQAVSGSNPKAQRVAAQQGLVNAKVGVVCHFAFIKILEVYDVKETV